jgi:cerevisin
MKLSLVGLVTAAVSVSASPVFGSSGADVAPLVQSENGKHIDNAYIIKFKDHVRSMDAAAHHSWVMELHESTESRKLELRKRSQFPMFDDAFRGLKHTYNIAGSFLGYSGHFDDAVIDQLRRHPDVSGCLEPPATSFVPPSLHATTFPMHQRPDMRILRFDMYFAAANRYRPTGRVH